MTKSVLLDAGPLITFLDKRDEWHEWSVEQRISRMKCGRKTKLFRIAVQSARIRRMRRIVTREKGEPPLLRFADAERKIDRLG